MHNKFKTSTITRLVKNVFVSFRLSQIVKLIHHISTSHVINILNWKQYSFTYRVKKIS